MIVHRAAWVVPIAGPVIRDGWVAVEGGRIADCGPVSAAPAGTPAPLTVEAELDYESIGYRWAENLRSYGAEETQRFGRYYAENAAASAVVIATATATVAAR